MTFKVISRMTEVVTITPRAKTTGHLGVAGPPGTPFDVPAYVLSTPGVEQSVDGQLQASAAKLVVHTHDRPDVDNGDTLSWRGATYEVRGVGRSTSYAGGRIQGPPDTMRLDCQEAA